MAQDSKYGDVEIPGIPADEPVFIIRGKDKAAPDAVEEYGLIAVEHGASREFGDSVSSRANEIRVWQKNNPSLVKFPD